jgi:tetratricopeptide (TPR) repeat protein
MEKKEFVNKFLRVQRTLRNLYYQDILNFSKQHPGDPKVYHLLAHHFHGQALEYFKKVIKRFPNYVVYRDAGFHVLIYLDKPEESIPYFKKALKLNPEDKETIRLLEQARLAIKSRAGDLQSLLEGSALACSRNVREADKQYKEEEKFLDKIYKKWLISKKHQTIREKFDQLDKVWGRRYLELRQAKSKSARLALAEKLLKELSVAH